MNMTKLVEEWRNLGPARWAEHKFGWLLEDGTPVVLEPWQRAVLAAWEAHKTEVTTLAISNVKKTGKTTVNAILTAWRWLALPGEHFCAANDLDQSVGRQFGMVAKMVERHPLLKAHVKSVRTALTFEPTGSTLEALSVDAAGSAGANHSTVSVTESWGIIYEGGIRAWEELTPPPDLRYGLPAIRVADSYAGYEGESVTWHELVDRGLTGERVSDDWPIFLADGLLLFHMDGEEAQQRCFRGTSERREVYYREQQRTLRAGAYSRLHLNKRAVGESQFVNLALWDSLVSPDCRPVAPGDRRVLYLGADAGTKRDFVALVGCVWNDKRRRVELAYVREWRPRELARLAGGVDLDETLYTEVLRLHREYNVGELLADPWQLASLLNRWQKEGIRVQEFPQSAQRTAADTALYDSIQAKTLMTFPSPALREAVRKAAAKDTERGTRLVKQPGDDLCIALSMAHYAASQHGSLTGWVGRVGADLSWTGFVDGEGNFRFVGHDDSDGEPDPRRPMRMRVERYQYSDTL